QRSGPSSIRCRARSTSRRNRWAADGLRLGVPAHCRKVFLGSKSVKSDNNRQSDSSFLMLQLRPWHTFVALLLKLGITPVKFHLPLVPERVAGVSRKTVQE